MKPVYTAKNRGLTIYVGHGNKGKKDFIIYVKTKSGAVPPFISDPDGRPKHIEWVNLYRDFYRFSHSRNPRFSENKLAPLPYELATSTYVRPIKEVGALPTPHAVNSVSYRGLLNSIEQHVGSYEQAPLDFIVPLLELLFIQEVTNYSKGVLHVLLPQMLRDELLGTLPESAGGAGETLSSLQSAVTSIAAWETHDRSMRLLKKWRGFYGI